MAAPLLDSSSGWACTAISRSASSRLTHPLWPMVGHGYREGLRGTRGCGVTLAVRLSAPQHHQGVPVPSTDSVNSAPPVTWLTQEAHDRLSKELDELIANRAAIAKEINDRREEGDLRENGGYHAAREGKGQPPVRLP